MEGVVKKEDVLYPVSKVKRSWLEYAKDVYRTLRKEFFYNLLLYPIALRKHQQTDRDIKRCQEHTYTAFYRSPGQLAALVDKVMGYILNNPNRPTDELFQINVLSGSIGAEAYTLSSIIIKAYPDLDFHINCSDLHGYIVSQAKCGKYTESEVRGVDVPEGFIRDTFDLKDGFYYVKDHIKNKVTFCEANIVSDTLVEKHPMGDLIFVQNVLFHLDKGDDGIAFRNAMSLAKERSVIFMDGMSLDRRILLTKEAHLKPLNYRLKEIHDHARRHVPDDWWNYYYGAEPYLFFKKDKVRRYSTIFMR